MNPSISKGLSGVMGLMLLAACSAPARAVQTPAQDQRKTDSANGSKTDCQAETQGLCSFPG